MPMPDEEDSFNAEAVLDRIREKTPDGWVWKLKVDEEFGLTTLRVILKRDVWYGSLGMCWSDSFSVDHKLTPEKFRKGVLVAALRVLDKRAETYAILAAPDWKQLAKEIQAELNVQVPKSP
ncbi:hypothetical protein FHT44_004951 [Mycolicibacterium sp. BK634]|uniref:hypothetical protein n=1 Tax=Mycolicibacterium sp. BK634 TaxID=2587099 RepID=UPI00161DDF01|nr:hypothetical protein [Mycolicibacterium sp. BK634]MBB3752439.1 hypothetical protein [Mycolicibacterium sp. BK634]